MTDNTFATDVISVLVPCYKCEKYLPKCLDSILNQRYPLDKIQVVLVNDESPDNVQVVIDQYAAVFTAR